MTGFPTAFSEITLVLFTTLAPSGALAYVLANLPIAFGRATDEEREHLDRSSWLLLAVTMVGLVASATHLGNPSNALYVFTAVGKSPLSTEVFCAVVFLALAGVYWLYSFAERPRRRLQRAAVIATNVAALAFVAATAFAYNVGTVPTWSHPLVPISLFANALMGGPVLACLGFAAARFELGRAPWGGRLLGLSAAALAANLAVYAVMAVQLAPVSNELASVPELVPNYAAFIAAFAVLAAAGLFVGFRGLRARGRSLVVRMACASALVLAGLFVMRFTFYMSHLTIGLGI